MEKPPAFQLYASDFYMDTAAWDIDEIGIYFRLLMYQWVNKEIPQEKKRMARIAGCGSKKFTKSWEFISIKFSLNEKGFFQNKRMEEIRTIQDNYRENQRLAGIKGAQSRWRKDSNPNGDPNSNPNGETMALQSSSSSSLKEKSTDSSSAGPFKKPSKDDLTESALPLIREQINNISIKLYKEGTFLKINAFINKMKQYGVNERALLHALTRCYIQKPKDEPWGWCLNIIKVEDGNYNEREAVKKQL